MDTRRNLARSKNMRMKGSSHLVIGGISLLYATRAPFHVEGGKGTQSKVLKFQLRPDPLAN